MVQTFRIWLLVVLGIFKTPIVNCEYSELMNQKIGVRVEMLNLIYENETTITSTGHPRCRLTLHKDTCSSPQFKLNDTLSWSTRVCYKWVCDTTKYAMRVESCWIGTPKMPVFIVREDGCTIEKAILTSPVYTSFNRAAAIGWMAVRQKNMKYMHVGCTIRLCHLCDPACQEITPPRSCNDSRANDYEAMWNSSSKVKNLCFPSPSTTENSLESNFSQTFSALSNSMIFSIVYLLSVC
ncbi:hypothetical protein L5515_005427 [Caenorhabditis briggsae]|uniref:ZP domain-containing protein n=1 Tax=Caenorhabditis briggsae TaxID=6238 RepID=A0AAE9EKB2_CAEBR|nr:hypothetical protein L5515_005427 [Caenorhabditis briggsae]